MSSRLVVPRVRSNDLVPKGISGPWLHGEVLAIAKSAGATASHFPFTDPRTSRCAPVIYK
ncbi:hypothetical protein PGTUg99_030648 [Puccinia graminis f. sp. tritici]|uniref:Uncharacterized protein n=1 Tax=Puccinia graminis f. sp. tritici TaxID=56615 RepID=A0A5B0LX58_PUCGR|nr:hypothetical protein PGTUg99_030648 [Puccinia graminis f. sp. tritici]